MDNLGVTHGRMTAWEPERGTEPTHPLPERDESLEATVLIVDDETSVRRAIRRSLSDERFTFLEARSRQTALEAIVSSDVQVILLDLQLGADNGLTLLDDIVRLQTDAAVLVVTGVDELGVARRALRCGAAGYVRKPFDGFELRTHIYSALRHQRLARRARALSAESDRLIRRNVPCQLATRLALASRLRDAETGGHVERIGRFSTALARTLGHTDDEADLIGVAATTHDVGKIAIPDAILLKPGRLTVEEFEIMKQHTVIGGNILGGTDMPVLAMAAQIARSHHERWDGNGYPDRLVGDACPTPARIVGIVDVYDALVHARVYKPAWEESRVLALFEAERGKQFAPEMVDAFLETLPAIHDICAALPEEEVTAPNTTAIEGSRT